MTSTTTVRKSYGNRKLNTFSEDYLRLAKQKNNASTALKKSEDVTKLLKYIDDNVIGKNNAFLGPFGRRKGRKFVCVLVVDFEDPVERIVFKRSICICIFDC
ncbi:hypothetical protein QE152_g27077 [Popillia japonica]|uniref:Uncharacterized protein n=1 Tax=Popillia japonica TaxID=7064 RepID=A0AAW1JWS0_POPJA